MRRAGIDCRHQIALTYGRIEQIVGRERREPLNCEFRISDCGFEFAPPRQLKRSASLDGFMNAVTQKKRTEFMLRWSPAFLFGAVIFVLWSLRFTPFSLRYFLASVGLGLALTILILICWKLASRQPLDWLLGIPTILLFSCAPSWVEAWAFPVAHTRDVSWWLGMQYLGIVGVVFFTMLFVFRVSIKKLLFGDAEQLVGRERREHVSHRNWSGDA